jgi:hypothetical protein
MHLPRRSTLHRAQYEETHHMRKVIIAALLATAGSLALPAYAGGHDPYRGGKTDIDVYGGNAKVNANIHNSNHNIAKGGDAYSGSSASVNNRNNNTNYQHQSQEAISVSESNSYSHSSSDNANNASQSVNFEAQARNPVSTAYAPPLAVGEDTCMGSSSIGGQGVGFGLSIGTSWTDENCQRLKNSRQLAALGYRKAAAALLCVNDDVARAMAAAGLPCRVQNGRSYELSTVALQEETVIVHHAPPPRDWGYRMTPVDDYRPAYKPRRHHKPKARKNCRMVRKCTR